MNRWGLCFGPGWQSSIADLVDPARDAEAAGFDRLTTGEYASDALTWLGSLAAATISIPIATTIASIAVRHPTVLAEGVAALRDLHGDRIEIGLGVSHPEIVTEGLGLRQPTLDDLESYTEVVRSTMRGEPSQSGRYTAPRHGRRRRVTTSAPVLVASLAEQATMRAARYADGVILTWSPATWTRHLADSIRRQDAELGRHTRIWVVLPTLPHPDVQTARVATAHHLRPYLELGAYRRMLMTALDDRRRLDAARGASSDTEAADALGTDLLASIAGVGDPDSVKEAVRRQVLAGADAVILYPLDTGAGWSDALYRTIDHYAPT